MWYNIAMKKKLTKVDIVEKETLVIKKGKVEEKETKATLVKSPGFDPDLPLKKQREFL